MVSRTRSWLAQKHVQVLGILAIALGVLVASPVQARAASQIFEFHVTNSSDTDLVFDGSSGNAIGCSNFVGLPPPNRIAVGSSAIFQVYQCGDPFSFTFKFHLDKEPGKQLTASVQVSGQTVDLSMTPPAGYITTNDPSYNASNDPGPPNFVDSEIFDCNSRTCDGIPDAWKVNGYTDLATGQFVDLPKMGADVNKPDIFLQIDWMADNTHSHQLDPAAIQKVVQAFANSGYRSRTGSVGINLHVDEGPSSILNYSTDASWGSLSRARQLTEVTTLGSVDAQGNYDWSAFAVIKNASGGFASTGRLPVFHYVISAHDYAPVGNTSSGLSRGIIGSDLIVSLGSWPNQTGTVQQQAGTLMHELGHNLGLGHGGADGINFKPNYLSIMNYMFQTVGLTLNGTAGIVDYSHAPINLDETQLDENTGLGSGGAGFATSHYCPSARGRQAGFFPVNNADGPIDWNCDGSIETQSVSADINNDGNCVGAGNDGTLETSPAGDDVLVDGAIRVGPDRTCETTAAGDDSQDMSVGAAEPSTLKGYDDWDNLIFAGGAIGGNGSNTSLPMVTAPDSFTTALEAALHPITATGTTATGQEGSSFSGTLATFGDGDLSATADQFAATIDWGDQTPTTGAAISSTGGGQFAVSGSHTYAEEGLYAVTISIVHLADPRSPAVTPATIAVGDAPLAASGVTLNSTNPVDAVVANFTDADPNGIASDYTTASIDWGDGSPSSVGTVLATATGFSVTGSHTYAALGPYSVSIHICDVGGSCADATSSILVFAYTSGGSFAVGNLAVGPIGSAVGKSVTFWGSTWAIDNPLSNGPVPSSFKGFEDNPPLPGCGVEWTTDPGNSAPPPLTVPAYTAIIVASSIGQSGAAITGNDIHIVIVKSDPGYGPQPSTPGTGTIVAVLC
jgi:reprolysin-like metallo-peptidase family M12B